MRCVVQRVSRARVLVDGAVVGAIERGFLVLVGALEGDTAADAAWVERKLLSLRVFPDEVGKMNRSVVDVGGSLLLVSQFTLAADTQTGNRPSFISAAPPEKGKELFDYLQQLAKQLYPTVEFGQFGADMQVSLVNNGPVTFTLRTR